MADVDVAVVGAGLVGLATACAVQERCPGATVAVFDKEDGVARHQSGRNSGVIHSGVSYAPGSLKATLAVEGRRSLVALCREVGIPLRLGGKVVVAGQPAELTALAELERRGAANGVATVRLNQDELAEREPHVGGVAALLVPEAGVVDFRRVASHLAAAVEERGGTVQRRWVVERFVRSPAGWRVVGSGPSVAARVVVGCAGLHADRLARSSGLDPPVRVVPFRGEFHALRPERRHLVRGLVYPVPDPQFPFLGVHLTRGIDDRVLVGPNAVLALAREGYRWADVDLAELRRLAGYPGGRRLARRHWRTGLLELAGSLSTAVRLAGVRRLVPEVTAEDLVAAPSGVRAQAVAPDGSLVDDFLVVEDDGAVHVLNAPSPAATAALAIGRRIAATVARHLTRPVG